MTTNPAAPVPNPVQHRDADVLGADYDQRDLRQAINDMNQRIRYAADEYDTPPSSIPLPP